MARHRQDETSSMTFHGAPDTSEHDLGRIAQSERYRASLSESNSKINSEHFDKPARAPWKTWAANVVDRAMRTGLQTAGAYMLTGFSVNLPADRNQFIALGTVVLLAMSLSVATSVISAPTFNNSYWFQVLERAVKTFSQTFVAGVGVDVASSTVVELPHNLAFILYSATVATVTSLVMSVYTTSMGSFDVVDLVSPNSDPQ